MKHLKVTTGIPVLFALSWVALHDIIKGEPDVLAEWVVVFLSGAGILWLLVVRS